MMIAVTGLIACGHPPAPVARIAQLPAPAPRGRRRWPAACATRSPRCGPGAGLVESYERSARIVAAWPELERELAPSMALALSELGRDAEALPIYLRSFALGDDRPDRVARTAEGYHRSARALEDRAAWDRCEVDARY
jgi:hypothetical protein